MRFEKCGLWEGSGPPVSELGATELEEPGLDAIGNERWTPETSSGSLGVGLEATEHERWKPEASSGSWGVRPGGQRIREDIGTPAAEVIGNSSRPLMVGDGDGPL